jgi:uncharacterized phage protein (predicted DNA packaging)
MTITDYITLAEAKKHLNVDSTFIDDDDYITGLLNAALRIVAADCTRPVEDLVNADGLDPIARSAILLKLGSLYAYREDVTNTTVNEVPLAYSHLTQLLRDFAR